MAGPAQKDLLSRLADAGEIAMKTLADAPGADRVFAAVVTLRDRLDELQRRVRGLENLEQRLTALERRVDELSASGSSSKSRKTSSTRKPTATKSESTEASRSRAPQSGS